MFCSSCFVDNPEGLEACARCGEVLLPSLSGGSSRTADAPSPGAASPDAPGPAETAAPGGQAPPSAPPVAATPAREADAKPRERRTDPRLEIPVSLLLHQPAADGRPEREERTIAENISAGGVQVRTTWVDLGDGDRLAVSEIGGDFEALAEVRGAWRGPDHIPRLNLEFTNRRAPSRLVGTGSVAEPAAAPERTPSPPESAPTDATAPPVRTSVAAAAASARSGGGAESAEEEADRQALRDDVLTTFQSLRTMSYYDLLAIPRDSGAGAIRAAYARRARRFHPDRATRDLSGLRSAFEAILVKLGEAVAVLEDEGQRRYYDARLGAPPAAAPGQPPPRPQAAPGGAPQPTSSGDDGAAPPARTGAPVNAEADVLRAERAIKEARKLFAEEKYWDVIRLLDSAMIQTQSSKTKLTMRVIWAQATSKNPKWLRRAEEALLEVIKEDPRQVEAHFELGQLYTAGGLTTRAQRMYRRVLELEASHQGAAAALNSLLTTRRL